MNPIFVKDSYKDSHPAQYPADTTRVVSNWTARNSRMPGQTTAVAFGLQRFIKTHLLQCFQEEFFALPVSHHRALYKAFTTAHYGRPVPFDHFERLHEMGYLPLDIYAIPEGFATPLGCPQLVITNTADHAYWLPNFLETALSCNLWKPITSATRAQRFRRICEYWGREAGETDLSYVDFQCHDFSMRGMSGMEDVILSGLGHLTCFRGTDSQPPILDAVRYYHASFGIGASVPATEHAVMCAGGDEHEQETFRRLIEDVYPEGIVSIVSDTWNLWDVLTKIVPALREKILARPNGVVVVRPDSGEPVKIVLGDDAFASGTPAAEGVLRLLGKAMGLVPNPTGPLPLIDHAACIYGDSIDEARTDAILRGMVMDLKMSPKNQIFGVGSWTYEYCTRDTMGLVMKATAVVRGGKLVPIFKCPVTGVASTPKTSHRGIPAVFHTADSNPVCPTYEVRQGASFEDLANCALQLVFHNGRLLVDENFETIRRRVRAGV